MLNISELLSKEEVVVRFIEELYAGDVEATCSIDTTLSRDRLALSFWSNLCNTFESETVEKIFRLLRERWATRGIDY